PGRARRPKHPPRAQTRGPRRGARDPSAGRPRPGAPRGASDRGRPAPVPVPALDERGGGQGATRPELLLLPEPPARRPADPRQPAHVSLRAAAALPARPGPARSGAAVAADLRAPQLGARAGRRAWAAPAADGLPPLRHRHDRSSPGQRALDHRRGAAAGPLRASPKNRAARAKPADRPHQEGAGRPLRFLPTELRLRGLSPRSNAVPAKPALGRGDSDALAPAPRWP